MHGHGSRPYLCQYEDCERSFPGQGFPRRYNLFDHMKRVHQHEEPTTTLSSSDLSRQATRVYSETTSALPAPSNDQDLPNTQAADRMKLPDLPLYDSTASWANNKGPCLADDHLPIVQARVAKGLGQGVEDFKNLDSEKFDNLHYTDHYKYEAEGAWRIPSDNYSRISTPPMPATPQIQPTDLPPSTNDQYWYTPPSGYEPAPPDPWNRPPLPPVNTMYPKKFWDDEVSQPQSSGDIIPPSPEPWFPSSLTTAFSSTYQNIPGDSNVTQPQSSLGLPLSPHPPPPPANTWYQPFSQAANVVKPHPYRLPLPRPMFVNTPLHAKAPPPPLPPPRSIAQHPSLPGGVLHHQHPRMLRGRRTVTKRI
jgi:hypothetical protein